MASIETESIMERLRQNRNITDPRGRMLPGGQQTRFLTHKEKKNRQEEMDTLNGNLNQPAWVNKGLPPEARKTLVNRRNHVEDDLKANSAPEIDSATRDHLYKHQKNLEARISEGMPTQEVMRRNPVGAVDKHMKWEQANKELIREWKNTCRLVEPDNEEKDYTNVERLRKAGITQDMAASFMMDAQVPGHFGMTPLAKANWPEGMPEHGTVDTALKYAERRELAQEVAQEEGITDSGKIAELEEKIKQLQAIVTAQATPRTKDKKATFKAHIGAPWTCPQCGEHLLTTQKGVHNMWKHGKGRKAASAEPDSVVEPSPE
jgi:hypothetical protein|tara:strand:+ start:12183 stop:13139 length:957 start_codon:yes stop_codon:yes gene_type:complete